MRQIVMGILLLGLCGYAQGKEGHKHKHLKAHVHGKVKLDITADKSDLLVEMESPAESFLGFEYRAKTPEEKALVAKVKEDWRGHAFRHFSPLDDCKIVKSHWKQKFSGKRHSSIVAGIHIRCPESMKKRKLSVSLKKRYPSIDEIHLRLVGEGGLSRKKEFSTPEFQIPLGQ